MTTSETEQCYYSLKLIKSCKQDVYRTIREIKYLLQTLTTEKYISDKSSLDFISNNNFRGKLIFISYLNL